MANFKARARTLEMLGKQQIAGIPTAINELFKNAHDAYADKVVIDYFRLNKLFILRDDGIGMSKLDFENRWLTIGTESKFVEKEQPKDPNKELRPILGEKGIGRLAIASIGPQVLILSRPKYGNDKRLTILFINWSLFELPGINLEEIIIPLKIFDNDKFPSYKDILEMIDNVKANINNLVKTNKINNDKITEIFSQLNKFKVDPFYWESNFKELSLLNNKWGTHFFIQPTDEILDVELDEGDPLKGEASSLQKLLIGFTNTLTIKKPVIETSFKDHKNLETFEVYDDLIAQKEFFTNSDFKKTDHHVNGEFNEYGQFNGFVKIYDNNPINYVLPWQKGLGKITSCGKFRINFAYVQPEMRTTHLKSNDHLYIRNKLEKFSGLYLYKDNIRILPYGNSDFDFLNIEKRRTLSAGYYFFSYRNMFGAIEINGKDNKNLREKAGREGFIENRAYKEFKDILIYFLIQLATDFFRKEGMQSDLFLKQREEYESIHEARLKRTEDFNKITLKLRMELDDFFLKIKNNMPQNEIDLLIEKTKKDFETILKDNKNINYSESLFNKESLFNDDLDKIRKNFNIVRPKGYAIDKDLRFDWEAYQAEFSSLEKNLFYPAKNEIDKILNDVLKKYKVEINLEQRLYNTFEYTYNKIIKSIKLEDNETKAILKNLINQITDLSKELLNNTEEKIKLAQDKYRKLIKSNIREDILKKEARKIEDKLFEETQMNCEIFQKLRNQLDKLILNKSSSGKIIMNSDISEAMEEELISLRERVDTDLILSQLGLAVGVIHHEFNHSVKSLRDNISRLKLWADKNFRLKDIYENIRNSFEHLDGYLSLFTPLNRRLYRKKIDIIGSDIINFIKDIFVERFRRHNVELSITIKFNQKIFQGYPSTFYPVFVNIVDNMVFWLKNKKGERIISFDADDKGISIENNGPEINRRDEIRIFEMGFTRKPMGRGMGLAISKEVLEKEGYKIFCTSPSKNMNVKFRIEENPSLIINQE